MFIELTDHLRCPAAHDEAFVVLLPERTEGRRVLAGELGCPVCHWSVRWDDGIPVFDQAEFATGELPFDADAAVAMLAVDGPGGWLATAGNAGMIAHALAARLPGVNIVAVNPPASVESSGDVSVVRSTVWPLKAASMRGVVVGEDAAAPEQAVSSALPGLRACGSGPVPAGRGIDVLAHAGDAWVVRRIGGM